MYAQQQQLGMHRAALSSVGTFIYSPQNIAGKMAQIVVQNNLHRVLLPA